jgi:hypothetical protein
MKDFFAGAAVAMGLVAMVFFLVILSTLMGGIAGWIVGIFFHDTIMNTLDRFGVETFSMSMWQLGATLGFISGFFKSSGVKVNNS